MADVAALVVLLVIVAWGAWPVGEFLLASVADAVMNRIHRRRGAKQADK